VEIEAEAIVPSEISSAESVFTLNPLFECFRRSLVLSLKSNILQIGERGDFGRDEDEEGRSGVRGDGSGTLLRQLTG
jgi:hypothetical protein